MDGGEHTDSFDRQEDEGSASLLLSKIGYSVVVVVTTDSRVMPRTPGPRADDALLKSLAIAPEKILSLCADVDSRTVYAGNAEAAQLLRVGAALGPVELFAEDEQGKEVRYTLSAIRNIEELFVFRMHPSGKSEDTREVTPAALRKRHARTAIQPRSGR
ncbi:hypothetical protein A3B35_03145 [Candidatus Kaiserbacteria bacterium RIFCSPLOWO2_01_FULL_54_24]|uniref:Uncharacterized protein n=1 Tax=Candidatus Kaiserbacteria bacterium RIFCSPLOWO2_01_FULL_54_24 TaxID=1798515 RepID=A0A1F6EVV6_9BACT|nr:MAG: hypothetical protein A3B35_03145 [Candidatus Kaiserbacteria bacterium RIFCSPLOWO2_01_FULL_54_24]